MLVSVIVPCYNAEKYIEDCLRSIINNDYSELEIICINDGSTDNTASILESMKQKDSRITVIHDSNHGVSHARNTGLHNSHGDYIAFVDADDMICSEYFSALLKVIQKDDCDIAICEHIRFSDKCEMIEKHTPNREIAIEISKYEFIRNHTFKCFVWGRLYKKEVIGNTEFDESLHIAEDKAFNISLLCAKDNVKAVYINEKYYYYRYAKNSAMTKWNVANQRDIAIYFYNQSNQSFLLMDAKTIYLSEAIKNLLSYRYYLLKSDAEEIRKVTVLLKDCLKQAKKTRAISKKELIIFDAFIRFPWIYRKYRIHNDPSLLDWEKNQNK